LWVDVASINFTATSIPKGTTSKTFDFGFTATAGSVLMVAINADATATLPSGWTLGLTYTNEAVSYVWHRTAVGGETSVSWTQNGARPVAAMVWEFAPGSTLTGMNAFDTGPYTPWSVETFGTGTFIAMTVDRITESTPIDTVWTGTDGVEVADLSPYSVDTAAIASLAAYQMDHTESKVLNWSASSGDYMFFVRVRTPSSATSHHLFSSTGPGVVAAEADTDAVNLSVEFFVTSEASLTEIRYWQPSTGYGLGTRKFRLWDMTATSAAVASGLDVTPTTEQAGSWITSVLTTPYPLVIGRHYRAVVWHPAGRYSATGDYFNEGSGRAGIISGLLQALNDFDNNAASGTGQGQYRYASTPEITNDSYNEANYWVDVVVATPSSFPAGSLNAANAVYVGAVSADRVYMGTTMVWQAP
jgi:hypothetical protein